MALLVLGVVLWSIPYLFKRIAPGARARLGDGPAKGLVALCTVLGIVAMVIGYRAADLVILWVLPDWVLHLMNLMMVLAVVLMGVGNSKSRLRGAMRHPMLSGVAVWSVAHLLVNGDLASLVLFGGLGFWALVAMALINAREPEYTPYEGGTRAGDIRLALISAVVFAVIAAVHTWLGYWPFPG